jgi:hypothetical protein
VCVWEGVERIIIVNKKLTQYTLREMINSIIRTVLFVVILQMTGICSSMAQTQDSVKFPSGEKFKNAKFTYTIIPAVNNTWCYDINMEERLFIHQPSVPGLPGNEGFKTKEDAEKVAKLVIEKIKKGEMPPSVTLEEMKELKVIY